MEREINQPPKRYREELQIYMGRVVECWNELSHVTIYYEFNPARGNMDNCTYCKRNSNPKLLRYEKDHMGQVFWDTMCEKCSPKELLAKLSQG